MNIEHLRYFQTLAACKSYTQAAKQLFISQPALSYAMTTLEKNTQLALFDRSERGCKLTPAGEEYLVHVDRALRELELGKARARTIMGGSSVVRISLMRVLGAVFLPEAIRAFRQAFPDEEYSFDLELGIASEVVADLERGRSGIGLTAYVKADGIELVPVARQKLVVIVPPDHALASRDSISLAEAAQYPQVGFTVGTGLRSEVDFMLQNVGAAAQYLSEEREDYTVAGMVAAGLGIAITPQLAVFDQLDVKCLEIEDEHRHRIFYLAHPDVSKLTLAEERFIKFTKEKVAEDGLAEVEKS